MGDKITIGIIAEPARALTPKGYCVTINDTRVAGPRPLGAGKWVAEIEIDKECILQAMGVASDIPDLVRTIKACISLLEKNRPPSLCAHRPESQCDMLCAEDAHYGRTVNDAKQAVTKVTGE